jgi:hypothetical protein
MEFKLKARVSRSDVRTIEHALAQLAANGAVKEMAEDFIVEAKMEGASARQLNRAFLSALRKVDKTTTVRAEWTSSDNTTESFFDYVLRKMIGN